MENDNSNVRIKTCPQCQTKFSCCIEKCWCSEMPMIMSFSDNLDCYCPDCLEKIIKEKIENSNVRDNIQSKNVSKVLEDEDYYYNKEGYLVFTSHYHLKRGYCCKNRCKHCPYGFSKEK